MAVALEIFERAARAFAAAASDRAVALGTSPTADARLVVLDSERLDAEAEDAEASREEMEAARAELQDALTAHAVGVPVDGFVRAKRHLDEDESPDVLQRKYELAGELFAFDTLRQRIWARLSSKTLNYGRLDWEVIRKHADDDFTRPDGDPVPLALVDVRAWGPKTGDAARSGNLVFMMDEIDLEEMIDGLVRLRKAFRENGGSLGDR